MIIIDNIGVALTVDEFPWQVSEDGRSVQIARKNKAIIKSPTVIKNPLPFRGFEQSFSTAGNEPKSTSDIPNFCEFLSTVANLLVASRI